MHHPINNESFRTHYRPVGDSASKRNDCLLVKVAGAQGWQLYHLHIPIVYKFWEPQTPGTLRARLGLYRDRYNLCINISTFSHRTGIIFVTEGKSAVFLNSKSLSWKPVCNGRTKRTVYPTDLFFVSITDREHLHSPLSLGKFMSN